MPSSFAAATRPWPARIVIDIIDEDWVGKAEALDAVGDLPDLLFGMHAGIPLPQSQC